MQSRITLPVTDPDHAYALHAIARLLSRETEGDQELTYVFLNEELARAFRTLIFEAQEHMLHLEYTPDYDLANWNKVQDDMLDLVRLMVRRTTPPRVKQE